MASVHQPAQPELDLHVERGAAPDLQEAYERTRLADYGVTLDQALKESRFAIPLRRVAQQLAAIRVERSH